MRVEKECDREGVRVDKKCVYRRSASRERESREKVRVEKERESIEKERKRVEKECE